MIVDFIEVKRALDKAAHLFLRAEIRKRVPFVSQIGVGKRSTKVRMRRMRRSIDRFKKLITG